MSLVSLCQKQYIASILAILKFVSFHELYMEKQREQLAHNQLYDPLSAFKIIDAFKSGEIVGFEVRSFLENYGLKASDNQCEKVLHSVNKGFLKFTYNDFEELTLPSDTTLRNLSLGRYKEMKIQIGVLGKVYEIKQVSGKRLAAFLYKQVEFQRQLSLYRLRFCERYGGDLYSFSQIFMKGKAKELKFEEFYEVSRQCNYFFNQDQFKAIYLRTKSFPLYFQAGQRLKIEPKLTQKMLSTILQTSQLDLKKHIRPKQNSQNLGIKQPSYKVSVFERQRAQKLKKQQQERNTITERLKRQPQKTQKMSFNYIKPEMHFRPKDSREYFHRRHQDWKQEVEQMSQSEINIRYRMLNEKKYPYF